MFTSRFRPAAHGPRALASLILFIAPPHAVAQAPDSIDLSGTVRDFGKDHVDFDVNPVDGNGHHAGNIGLTLGADGRPAFVGGGFKVASQWRNSGSEPIAPHLYRNPTGAALRLAKPPTISEGVVMDSWDPSLGPYGGANVGPAPSMEIGASMPTV
ncbi:MAG: hypothetical protein ACYS5V_06610, partial [Planctomycetota bacterium]